MTTPLPAVIATIERAIHELVEHEGFGELRVEVRLLRRGQKEIIVHFGKQHRYVVDATATPRAGVQATSPRGG